MGEHDRRHEQDLNARHEGGAAVSSGSSSSDLPPPSDAPTLVPGAASGPDAPTLAPFSPDSPYDAPTMDGTSPPPKGTSRIRYFAPAQPSLEAGAVLAQRYEIVRTLGEGGMGAVYQARDLELGRMVALKVIRPDLAKNPAIIERFKQEILLSQKVTHKNVIRIYDLGEGEGVKFITMEFIEGRDLRSVIHERKKLPPGEAVEIMEQICLALEAAHSVGVIHRDLKPQNVMREESGRILVMDFGLARNLEGGGMTQTGALVGTMEYMSPEQALAKDLDQRSDLFSAGLIFYELLTGQMPYRADSALASLIRRTQERAVSVLDYDSTIPAALSQIVSRCLERDPAQRYQTSAELLADLQAWQGKRTAGAIAFQTVKPWGQTIPWPKIGGAVAVLVLAVSGYMLRDKLVTHSTDKKIAAGPTVSLAIMPFRNASGDPSWDWWGPSLAETLSTDVGQSAHLRTVSPDRLQQALHDLRIDPNSIVDSTTLQRVANSTDADTVVWGSYTKLGDQIRVDATLQDLKHNNRTTSLKAAAPDQKSLPAAIDKLAETIRQNLALSPDLVKELRVQTAKPTTGSMEALRDYSQGLQLARQGSNLDALKHFQAAVQEDPQFALAFARLAETYAALGHSDEADQASQKAVELSQNLPLTEKYFIEASHARVTNDNKKAIEAYENLAASAPDNLDVQYALGDLYLDQGAYDKAKAHYGNVLKADPKNMNALLQTGWLEVISGNPQGGMGSLNQALTLAIDLDNTEQRAQILQAIGVGYERLNKPDEALRNLHEALDINRRLDKKGGVANSLVEIAHVQRSMGKPAAAQASLNEALQLEQSIGDKKGAADTLIDLGQLFEDRGELDKALQAYKESNRIQVDVGDQTYHALCLSNIANVYLAKGQNDDALTYYQQALQVREQLGEPTAIAETLHNLGEGYAQTARYDDAMASYMRAVEYRRKSGDRRGEAVDSHGMGMVFVYQGRYGAAVSSLQEAVKTFHDLKDNTRTMAEILNDYGWALALSGRGAEASKPLEEAHNLAAELKNDAVISATLNAQGEVQFYRGDLKAAKDLYQQALQSATRAKAQDQILRSKMNLARVAIAQGQSQAAIGTLRQLSTQASTLGLRYLTLQCSLNMAQAMVNARDHGPARPLLEQLLGQSEKLNLRMDRARIQYLLGTSSRLAGNASEAAGHYREAVRLLDEIKHEAGAQDLLQRVDLKSMYEDSARWSQAQAS